MVLTRYEKEGQSVIVSILTLLFGSIMVVSAAVLNSTNETILVWKDVPFEIKILRVL